MKSRLVLSLYMGDCRLGGLLGTSTPPWGAQAS